MNSNSGIQWTDCTWNPVTGCTRVSAGCDHCYAVTMTNRLEAMGQTDKYGGLTVLNNKGDRHFNGVVKCHDDALEIPLRWRKPRRIFVNSMSDLFHKEVPFEFIDKVFAVMALCPQHTFQILTKRPERMAEYLNNDGVNHGVDRCAEEFFIRSDSKIPWRLVLDGRVWPLPNVWLGTSVENQSNAYERIPHLLRCPAAVRFLSCEPLLGPIDRLRSYLVNDYTTRCPGSEAAGMGAVNWVIVGGESGKGARPCDIEWIRSVVKQCADARVACFVKQLGSRPIYHDSMGAWFYLHSNGERLKDSKGGDESEWPADLRVRQFPKGTAT